MRRPLPTIVALCLLAAAASAEPSGIHPAFARHAPAFLHPRSTAARPLGGFVLSFDLWEGLRLEPGEVPGFDRSSPIRVVVRIRDLRLAGEPGRDVPASPPVLRLRHEASGEQREVEVPVGEWAGGLAGCQNRVEPYESSGSVDLAALDPPLAEGAWEVRAVLNPRSLRPAIGGHREMATGVRRFVVGPVTLADAVAANAETTAGEGAVELSADGGMWTLRNRTAGPIVFSAAVLGPRGAAPPLSVPNGIDVFTPLGWQEADLGYCGTGYGPVTLAAGEAVALRPYGPRHAGIVRYRLYYRTAEGEGRAAVSPATSNRG